MKEAVLRLIFVLIIVWMLTLTISLQRAYSFISYGLKNDFLIADVGELIYSINKSGREPLSLQGFIPFKGENVISNNVIHQRMNLESGIMHVLTQTNNSMNRINLNFLGPAIMGPHPEDMPMVRTDLALNYYGAIYFEEDVLRVKPYIDDLHMLGIKYITYNAFDHVEPSLSGINPYERVPELVENGTVINLDGERIVDYMGLSGYYQHSILRSVYRDFLMNVTRRAIDAGADGVAFDVGICLDSFDPESMRGFRDFLASKYNETYLLEKYNITDISSFDYGQYLRDRGYNASTLQQALVNGTQIPLWDEWELYKISVEREFFKRLYTELGSYASEKYGREFYITANRYWSNRQWAAADYLSLLSAETFIEEVNYPRGNLIPMYKAALGVGKGFWSWNLPSNIELLKLFIAETYACMGISQGVNDDTAAYHLFIISHPELFNNTIEDSEVAILYSVATHKRDYADQQTAFRGAVYLLMDSHFTFDVIIGGDNSWINDTLSLDRISKYRAVFLPDTKALTDNQVAVLMNYTARGGILIGTGGSLGGVSGLQIGRYDENWNEVNRSEWNKLFNGSIVGYGNGTVISWVEDITSTYYNYAISGNDTGRDEIRSEFLGRITPLLRSDISTNLPPEIRILRYRQSDGSQIYHLINYLYNSSGNSIQKVSGNLSLPIPEGWESNIRVSMMTPEDPSPTPLPFSQSNGRINISLSEIGIWTVVKVGSQAEDAKPPDYKPISRIEGWDQGRFWWNKPANLSFHAVDDHNLSRIDLYYRYSPDNISWSNWTFYKSQNVSGSNIDGNIAFDPSQIGEGYYTILIEAVDDRNQTGLPLNCAQLKGGFDITPPPTPIVTEVHGVKSGVWQDEIYDPEFTWYQPPDNLSGINEFYLYWVWWGPLGNPQFTYTNGEAYFDPDPVPPNQTVVYYLHIALVDNAGNWNSVLDNMTEENAAFIFKYKPDATPPVTTANYDGSWHNTDFIIILNATDLKSGVNETYYRINDGAVMAVSIDGQPLITTEGENNTLEYWSVDNAGNEEPHNFLTGIKLDKTSPTEPSNFTINILEGNTTFTWMASADNIGVRGYYIELNGITHYTGNATSYTWPSRLEAASYDVSLWATDLASNNSTKITITFVVSQEADIIDVRYPAIIGVDRLFQLNVTVRNVGNCSGVIFVNLSDISGFLVGEVITLTSNETMILAFNLTAPSQPDTWILNVTVGHDSMIDDMEVCVIPVTRILIDRVVVSDDRCDVGTIQTVSFHAGWAHNGSDVVGGFIYINGTGYATNGTGWISFNVSCNTVGRRLWTVTGVSCYGIVEYEKRITDPYIIWDRLEVIFRGASDIRADVGSYVRIYFKVIREYDYALFDGTDGVVYINGTQASWDSINQRWYIEVRHDSVGGWNYLTSSIIDNEYDITTLNDLVGSQLVIWDRVLITLSIVDDRIDVGSMLNYSFIALYEYDGADATEYVSITLNDTLTKSRVGRYGYTVSSISESQYGLKAFLSNSLSIIFDRVNINNFKVYDNSINVGDTARFIVSGVYEYDGTAWSGTYTLNDTTTKSIVGKYGYKIESITDDNYGLKKFIQTAPDIYVIFDKLNVTLSTPDDRIDVGSTATINVRIVRLYDNSISNATATLNDTLTKYEVGRYSYTVLSISGDQYGITKFESNSISIIFDKVLITLKALTDKVPFWSDMPWNFTATYAYDHTDAKPYLKINLNDTTTSHPPGTYTFTVESIEETRYNLTAFESNTIKCTWEIPIWIYGAITTSIIAVTLIIIIKRIR